MFDFKSEDIYWMEEWWNDRERDEEENYFFFYFMMGELYDLVLVMVDIFLYW